MLLLNIKGCLAAYKYSDQSLISPSVSIVVSGWKNKWTKKRANKRYHPEQQCTQSTPRENDQTQCPDLTHESEHIHWKSKCLKLTSGCQPSEGTGTLLKTTPAWPNFTCPPYWFVFYTGQMDLCWCLCKCFLTRTILLRWKGKWKPKAALDGGPASWLSSVFPCWYPVWWHYQDCREYDLRSLLRVVRKTAQSAWL